ncbi:MBL fold metallo-hydrolase [Nonlabens ponticola]|uniref:MBL fold metallo-hydrolase n=1 Tax=Nonlabens ponticola TaxID=2496866 RepID=A0A3S9N080_9FLAO|nr:MBL fold metallo-hydrolase [Nonlabens ponticola]AZQ44789.1 MBL fold metallo-hydrolase [Nonlabens ponticola]
MKKLLLLSFLSLSLMACKDNASTTEDTTANNQTEEQQSAASNDEEYIPSIEIMPISHATFVMKWDDQIIYNDPVGGATAFEGKPEANIILVTDIHGDHLNKETLMAVANKSNFLFAPQAVADQLGDDLKPTVVLNNGDVATRNGLTIKAIPMYNITEGRLDKHVKGRGNGYVLEKNGYRVYISGDTEGIPEMRNLENIDKAFVCMNLPYTMDVEQAADAVLDFAPKEVIPFHYRGTDGLSDVEKFKSLVNQGSDAIEVTLMDWYPQRG